VRNRRDPTRSASNVGSRKCDVGLPAHASHPLSRLFRVFRGPHSLGRACPSELR